MADPNKPQPAPYKPSAATVRRMLADIITTEAELRTAANAALDAAIAAAEPTITPNTTASSGY